MPRWGDDCNNAGRRAGLLSGRPPAKAGVEAIRVDYARPVPARDPRAPLLLRLGRKKQRI